MIVGSGYPINDVTEVAGADAVAVPVSIEVLVGMAVALVVAAESSVAGLETLQKAW